MVKGLIRVAAFLLALSISFSAFFSFQIFAEESGGFIYYVSENGAVLSGISGGVAGSVEVPYELGGLPVISVDGAFSNKSDITDIILPDSVSVIGANSFAGCTGLKSITLSSQLSFIGDNAFSGCVSLEEIILPDGVSVIGSHAFYDCLSLEHIVIPDSVNRIMQGAFEDTQYYNTYENWQDDVLYIGKHLIVAQNTILGTYMVKPGTISLADHAFSGCNALKRIIVYKDVVSIGEYAFENCKNIFDVYYSGTVANRQSLNIMANNNYFNNAVWHYNYDPYMEGVAPGDINGDGNVNNKDALRLFKYLSGWNVHVVDSVVDVNLDERINNKDLTRLFKYLSGWDVKIFNTGMREYSSGDDQGPIISF